MFNKFNLFAFIFPFRIIAYLTSLGKELIENKTAEANILDTGALGKFQKITLQYSNAKNEPVSYLKVSNTHEGIERIKVEEGTLNRLTSIQFNHTKTPKLLSTVKTDNLYGLLQNIILHDETITPHFNEHDEKSLVELYTIFSKKEVKLSTHLTINNAYNTSRKYLTLIENFNLSPNETITLTASHGDYTPWNRFIDKGVVKIIDWEIFAFRPVFYDVCFFIVNKSILIDKTDIIDAINECKNIIKSMLIVSQVTIKLNINFYIALAFIEMNKHYKNNENKSDSVFIKNLNQGIEYLYNSEGAQIN